PLPPNAEARPWVDDMNSVYPEITAMVRLTTHDGTSFMAVESIARARYVLWSYPMAGAIQVSGLEDTANKLRELASLHEQGKLGLNEDGRAALLKQFDTTLVLNTLDQRLLGLVRGQRT